LAAVDINGYLVREGKESRAQVAAKYIESGRVKLIKGSWNEAYIDQMTKFPNSKHDEFIDLSGYSCEYHFREVQKNMNRMFGGSNLI
jgi:phage terminase large subunit-like protein